MSLLFYIPIIRVYAAECKLQTMIENKKTEKVPTPISEIELDNLTTQLNSSLERKKSLEEKAKNNILGISLGVPLLFSGGSYLFDRVESIQDLEGTFIRTALGFGVGFLIIGGLFAFKAMRISSIYLLGLEDEIELASFSKNKKELERKKKMWRAIECNNLANLLKSNAIDESYSFLRSGIILLGCFIFYMLYSFTSQTLPYH